MADKDAILNPSDKSANVALSGGNLTGAVAGSSWASVRSTIPKSAGKVYFEVSTVGVPFMIGIGTSAKSLETYPGSSTGAYGYSYFSADGKVYYNGTGSTYGSALTPGDVLCVAVDYDAGKIWYGKNGTWPNAGNPATGANPAQSISSDTYYPMFGANSGGTFTVNFGASEFAYTPPIGYAESTSVEIPSASVTISIPSGILISPVFAPVASLTLNSYPPFAGVLLQIGSALALTISAETPSYKKDLTKHPNVAALTVLGKLPSYVWTIPASMRPAAQVIYTCTLTGDGESPAVSDLTLPMSSFQGRMRDGDPSYISAVIPNCMIYADDILARQNGDIVIKKGYRFQDGSTQLEEIARVDFESVRIDQGSKSASATISGHKTISSTSVKTVTVEGVSYYCLQADGKRRVRALLDLFLRIGDTCIYGSGVGDYMTVGYITYTVSVNKTSMEVTEA